MRLSKFQLAVIALIIANTIWGAAPPIYKWALENIGVFTFAFLRFTFASIILFPFCWNRLRVAKSDFPKMALVALFGVTMNILFLFIGVTYAPSINASIVGSAGPIFILFASIYFLKERSNRKIIIGAHIGLLGVLIIVLKPLFTHQQALSIIGNLFFILSLCGSIGQTLFGKKILEKYSPITVTFYSFAIGAFTFLPMFVYEVGQRGFLTNLSINGAFGILYATFFSSLIAYSLFFWALSKISASESSVFMYLDPLVTILVAAPLLHEYPDTLFIVGSILVFLGIYIAEGRIHYHPIGRLFRAPLPI